MGQIHDIILQDGSLLCFRMKIGIWTERLQRDAWAVALGA